MLQDFGIPIIHDESTLHITCSGYFHNEQLLAICLKICFLVLIILILYEANSNGGMVKGFHLSFIHSISLQSRYEIWRLVQDDHGVVLFVAMFNTKQLKKCHTTEQSSKAPLNKRIHM